MVGRSDRVLCGPEERTRRTAAAMGVIAEVDVGLADCDYGRWRGLTLDAVTLARLSAVSPMGRRRPFEHAAYLWILRASQRPCVDAEPTTAGMLGKCAHET